MKAQRYSSTLSLTSALHGSRWLTPHPGRSDSEKDTRYPLYKRLGGSQGRSGQVQKISLPPGFDQRTVQSVASRYTDWAIPAHTKFNKNPLQDFGDTKPNMRTDGRTRARILFGIQKRRKN